VKYTTSILIDQPRSKVIELFDSTENMYKWQPELLSFEHISGEPGQDGAKSKMRYKMGKREIDMIETITKQNFPDEFDCTYEANKVWNLQQNTFREINSIQTQWISISIFKCSGFMKIMCWLMPGAFKKQTLKSMIRFKEFAENAKDA